MFCQVNLNCYSILDPQSHGYLNSKQYENKNQVVGKQCQSCQNHGVGKNFYDCQLSESCQIHQDTYSIQYGSGMVTGIQAEDSVEFGNFSMKGFTFMIAKSVSKLSLDADGILGLGLDHTFGFESIIDQLQINKLIKEKKFAFFFNTLPQEVNNQSILSLGGIDSSYITNELKYYSLIDKNRWMISITKLFANNMEIKILSKKGLIDTGTSFIVLPPNDFTNLLETLRQTYLLFCQYQKLQILCSCPSGDLTEFPIIKLQIGEDLYELQPKEYINIQISTCELSFAKSEGDYIILGAVFLRKFIAEFDMDKKQIGLAEGVKFDKQGKLIQITDSLLVFKVLLCQRQAIQVLQVMNYNNINDARSRTPALQSRVAPKVLYHIKPKSAGIRNPTKIVKVSSPFEYLHYIQRRSEYEGKQREMLDNLQVDSDNFERLTYSIKQFGEKDGKIGIQSQRRFMMSTMESVKPSQSDHIVQSDRISYCFKSKRLPTSEKKREIVLENFTIPSCRQIEKEASPINITKVGCSFLKKDNQLQFIQQITF
ncbi:hypothetical protein pb186bvf_008428 [Paramecium bursaria]